MQNLFDYLLTGKDLTIIKGCFFHYEIEFMLAIIRASLKETVEETRCHQSILKKDQKTPWQI